MYTNAVYWPNYRIYNGDTPGQLNYGCINRVYYAFASVTAGGGVFVSTTKSYLAHAHIAHLTTSSVTNGPTLVYLVTESKALWGL